ncbi:MAG: phenylacetate-CoA oxygenase/reductase subunit PaaK [Crocinitomicaceae bacterium]|jgi:ring-1,2-phenylacetyl-CoA epoxidase subunit PaaE|nr:phenylacetate-CoA oxygenase/reductase subunit PaaK [Crocinitomicaceae bacterium]MDP4760603.1 phenylacetate-CoA oxygenase/reductase subunit PaaK [Crocinitomicaceae bacterium]
MTPKFHSLKIKNIRKETSTCVSISFEIPNELKEDFRFQSGQYLTLRSTINKEDVRRSYSLCSAPSDNEWRVAIKQVEKGIFSTYAVNELQEGQFLDVMNPMGNFKLVTDVKHAKSYVLFAAGSGVTPIFSILKSILREEPNSHVTMFYGNQGFAEVIFREELENLKNEYLNRLCLIHLFSRENLGNAIQKGRIDEQKCLDLHKAFLSNERIDDVFICGPEQMILDVKAAMLTKGVSEKSIHFELFHSGLKKTTQTAPSKESDISTKVTVILDDDSIEFPLDSNGMTILDAAYKAGSDVPYACKGGVCCTCKAKVLKGTVRMDLNYALTPEEVEAGYILTCQAHPTSEEVLVSFDD